MEQEELSMYWERKARYKRQCIFDDSTLLEKITHICVIQRVAIKLILAWEFHSYCLAFAVLEGALQVVRRVLTQLWNK